MSNCTRYKAYKNSDITWLREIPVGWQSMRMACFGRFTKGGGFSKADLTQQGEPAFIYGDIYTRYNFHTADSERFISAKKYSSAVKVYPNDILFAGSGEDVEDIGKCVAYRGDRPVAAGGDIIIFRPLKNNSTYLGYLLNTQKIREEKARSATGEIIVHTYGSKLREILCPIPPIKEQETIADFLDLKTSLIDRSIARKRKLIVLLKERNQLIIQNAVTKGLDASVKVKDSGIEWIGEIPAHWAIKNNRSLFTEQKRSGYETLPILSVSIHSGVSDDELSGDENMRGRVRIKDKSNYKLVNKDDIAYNMMRAWQGGIGRVSRLGMVSPAYVVASPSKEICTRFFEAQYRTPIFIEEMNRASKGITDFRKRLYWDEFKSLVTLLPPKSEQDEIIDYIEKISTITVASERALLSQIKMLNEYKTTLIDNVVTGKINVSNYGH